jgi:hypothetical protein
MLLGCTSVSIFICIEFLKFVNMYVILASNLFIKHVCTSSILFLFLLFVSEKG